MTGQQSLFEKPPGDSCRTCRYFAELKEPWVRKDGAIIYGYCFQNKYNLDEKGYAVFISDGKCKDFTRKRRTAP